MAFVTSTGVLSLSTTSLAGTPVSARSSSRPVARRNRTIVQASIQDEKAKKPGFTLYSEKVNGRMAMLGFTIGIMTEIINPNHPTILKQVASAFDFLPFVHALTM